MPPEPHLAVFNWFLLLNPCQTYPSYSIRALALSFVSHRNIISGLTKSNIAILMDLFSGVHAFTFHDTNLRLPGCLLEYEHKLQLD